MERSTGIITAQNIEIQLNYASLGDRIVAFLIDALIIFAYFFINLFFLALVFPTVFDNEPWVFTLFQLPVLGYSLIFETLFNGQSPGKRFKKIKVIKTDGSVASFSNYLLRWIFRPIDIIFYGAVAMISIVMTRQNQRLGDLAAGTTVIHLEPLKQTAFQDYSQRIKLNPGHQIQFPEVVRLSDKQIDLIHKTLETRKDKLISEPVDKMAAKVKEMLGVQSELQNLDFLYAVVRDYYAIQQEAARLAHGEERRF